MKDNQPIRWGIIGLGNIAHKFAEDLLSVPNTELYAVASRDIAKANKFAKKFNAKNAYGSYQHLAKNSKIDAVYIATPHVFHKENTFLCLNNGIAVLCEKPFAMNMEEVNDMISLAKSKNILLMEALWTYFLPSYQFVLNLIQNNTHGKLLKLEADFGFKKDFDNSSRLFNKSLGGGSLLDIGIYPIFAALTMIGIPNKIEAKADFFENKVDASCEMIFEYQNNVTAHLKSTLKENTPTQAKLYFEKAKVIINSQFHTPTSVTTITPKQTITKNFSCKTHGYSFEISHFNDLIKQGKTESDIMSFNKSKALIKTLDSVREIIDLTY